MMGVIEIDGVKAFFSSSSAQSIFHKFIIIFAQQTVLDSMWSRIKLILDQSEELALTTICSGAMVAGLFCTINYIQKVDNGVKSSRTNKEGKLLKGQRWGSPASAALVTSPVRREFTSTTGSGHSWRNSNYTENLRI